MYLGPRFKIEFLSNSDSDADASFTFEFEPRLPGQKLLSPYYGFNSKVVPIF